MNKIDQYALIFECAEKVSKFEHLADFLKVSSSHLYNEIATGKQNNQYDLKLFKAKLQLFVSLADELCAKSNEEK